MRGTLSVFVLLALCASVFAIADLTVSDINWWPQTPSPGDMVSISVLVMNQGNTTSNYTYTALSIDWGTYYNTISTPPLMPMGYYYANFTYNVSASPNPHTLTGVADLYNSEYEFNENNNNATEYMNVTIPNYCGDGNCTGNETCNNCVYDCGSCCGNGICESHYGETSVTCPADCPALECTPKWYCQNTRTRAYRGEDCRVTTFPCGDYFCCVNGICKKDLSNKCNSIIISHEVPDRVLAQTQGPSIKGHYAFAFAMVALIAIGIYAYVGMELGG